MNTRAGANSLTVKSLLFPECQDGRPCHYPVLLAAHFIEWLQPKGVGIASHHLEGLDNFRSVFLNTKELVFGRIPHAQLCGGDTVRSAISHFAYLH